MGINVCSPYLAIHSRVLGKKWYFECEKKEARTVFYISLTFSWRIDASVNHVNDFSSIFAANIRSRLFSANDSKCKPGLTLNGKPGSFLGFVCWFFTTVQQAKATFGNFLLFFFGRIRNLHLWTAMFYV